MKELIKRTTKGHKLLFMLMFSLVSLVAYAAATATINEVKYTTIDGTNEASVSGTTANGGKGPAVDNLVIPETVEIEGTTYTVTMIGRSNGAFKSTKQATLPNTITVLATEAFSYCRTVVTMDLSNTKIKNVGTNAFKNTSALSVLKLPATVVSFGNDVFTGSSVSKFFMYATDPSVIDLYSDNTALKSLVGKGVTLYVPAASVDAYKNHAVWGTTFTDIQAITDDANAATAISLSDGPEVLYPTQTTTLTVTAEPAGADMGTVVWSATPASVATIDSETGLITAVAAGTVTVKAVMGDLEATKDVVVSVLPAPTSIAIPASVTLVEDDEMTLSVTYEGGDLYERSIIWTSSDDNKVSVDSDGKIIALDMTESPVTITATSTADSSISATCAVTVESKVKVNSISINFDKDEIIFGSQYTLEYTVDPQSDDIEISWASDNLDVITIDATTGELKTVGVGEATITISVKNSEKQASIVVKVIKTAERIGLSIPDGVSAGDAFAPVITNPRAIVASQKWTINGYAAMKYSAGENLIRGEVTYSDGSKDVIVKYVNIQ